jgi:Ca-activated chloride channel family protein
VSFAAPLVLLGLLVVPLLVVWYRNEQRRRTRVAAAFVTKPLLASVAPRRPGWRRHAPYLVAAIALALLIIAGARPQHSVAVPINGANVVLANDVSNSMTSTDVHPSRLVAAQQAANTFLRAVPSTVQAGSVEFARHPALLQSPTVDHRLTRDAVSQLKPGGGGTAIGDAIETALRAISAAPKIAGKHAPGAIVLLSDGTSNVGVSPSTAASEARAQHVRIYTVSIGTGHGTMTERRHGRNVTLPVPVDPTQLRQIAATTRGRTYSAVDTDSAKAVYAQLAKKLGQKQENKPLTAGITVAGLVLLLIGTGMSLAWFARAT